MSTRPTRLASARALLPVGTSLAQVHMGPPRRPSRPKAEKQKDEDDQHVDETRQIVRGQL